jgi:hypothetical protein
MTDPVTMQRQKDCAHQFIPAGNDWLCVHCGASKAQLEAAQPVPHPWAQFETPAPIEAAALPHSHS